MLEDAISEMLSDFHTLSEANDQRIVIDIPDGQTCLAEPKMLRKALSNVILNAVQSTPKGGGDSDMGEPIADQYRLCV
jgi:two-component system sensor histidine kinase VanS